MKYVFNDERSPLRLFSDGDAVRAYDFLGAHFINLDGRNGVIFRVWAPNAITVSLVGDFNNWNQKLIICIKSAAVYGNCLLKISMNLPYINSV